MTCAYIMLTVDTKRQTFAQVPFALRPLAVKHVVYSDPSFAHADQQVAHISSDKTMITASR